MIVNRAWDRTGNRTGERTGVSIDDRTGDTDW
jgi:hypothetical protein